ncbi:hypothetical protein EBU58_14965 [bacterium]|nr:hypothetical protein [bacterium]
MGTLEAWLLLPSSEGCSAACVQITSRSAEMSRGPAGSTPSMTRFTPEVITATHSPPPGLGYQRTFSGMLDRGNARSRRADSVAVTWGPLLGANSLNCA